MKLIVKILSALILLTLLLTGYVFVFDVPAWAVNPILSYLAEGQVKAHLADPESAVFRNKNGVCGEVNSKNNFGGYTGFKRYVAGGEYVAIDDNRDGFEDMWQLNCVMTDEQRGEAIDRAIAERRKRD